MNILYKSNQVHILFKLSDGSIKGPYRFIYPVGSDGLFVKYFIKSQIEANRLFAGNASGLQHVDAIKLVTTPKSIDYDNVITSQFFSVTPPRPFKINWGEIRMPVEPLDNKPLPLNSGQKATVMFSVPKRQLDLPAQVSTVCLYQGNYGNTATGRLEIKICDKSKCMYGERPLSESHDNSFFSIHLDHALLIHPEDRLTLVIHHVDGNKPDALWIWPEKAGYPQELIGPQGQLPDKAISIALKYQIQEHR